MESIYFLGGELWLKNRIISVCCLHGVVTTVTCSRRRLSEAGVRVEGGRASEERQRWGSDPLFL